MMIGSLAVVFRGCPAPCLQLDAIDPVFCQTLFVDASCDDDGSTTIRFNVKDPRGNTTKCEKLRGVFEFLLKHAPEVLKAKELNANPEQREAMETEHLIEGEHTHSLWLTH